MHFVRERFALRVYYSLVDLEHALVKVEELKKQPDALDGHALAGGFTSKNRVG